jgi:hypothetical protein
VPTIPNSDCLIGAITKERDRTYPAITWKEGLLTLLNKDKISVLALNIAIGPTDNNEITTDIHRVTKSHSGYLYERAPLLDVRLAVSSSRHIFRLEIGKPETTISIGELRRLIALPLVLEDRACGALLVEL